MCVAYFLTSLFLFRSVPDPLLRDAVHRGYPDLLLGAGHRAEAPEGCDRSLEPGLSLHGRHRHQQRRRVLQRGPLLQHHHRLVPLLLRPGQTLQPLVRGSSLLLVPRSRSHQLESSRPVKFGLEKRLTQKTVGHRDLFQLPCMRNNRNWR